MGYMSPTYSNDDFRALLRALREYADEDLDQWNAWRLQSKWGEVYVTVSRSPGPDRTPEMFDPMSPEMPLNGDE